MPRLGIIGGKQLAKMTAAAAPFGCEVVVLKLVQDKLRQKAALADAGLPVVRFADAPSQEAVPRFGLPAVLKKRRPSCDGKGNASVDTAADLDAAWLRLDGDR